PSGSASASASAAASVPPSATPAASAIRSAAPAASPSPALLSVDATPATLPTPSADGSFIVPAGSAELVTIQLPWLSVALPEGWTATAQPAPRGPQGTAVLSATAPYGQFQTDQGVIGASVEILSGGQLQHLDPSNWLAMEKRLASSASGAEGVRVVGSGTSTLHGVPAAWVLEHGGAELTRVTTWQEAGTTLQERARETPTALPPSAQPTPADQFDPSILPLFATILSSTHPR
ncbi:MAG: hypothetical protein ACRDHX_07685, partial [Chloroflexota bacterium]